MYKSILVTGACGFIGSHYVNYMFDKLPDVSIINIDAMYYCASEDNIRDDIRNSDRYLFIKGNTCDYSLVLNCLTDHNIDCVINFAAQSHVQTSFQDALSYTKDNIVGTHTLLEACRIYGKIKLFIHVSTDEVYGESSLIENEAHKTENSVLCPSNPYAATKAGAELIVQSYYHSFKMPIIITRGNNVYGPRQYPEKLIPLFIKLLNKNQKLTVHGDGSNVRAFLYIDDVCDAFYKILTGGKTGEIYNIGCDEGQEYSVIDVAKILVKNIKKSENWKKWITYVEDRPFNDKRYYISNDKLKKLGWTIKVPFEVGIMKTINSYSDISTCVSSNCS